MSRSDRIALLFSLIALLLSILVTEKVFENMPHLEDEFAYAWQAQVIAHGQLSITRPLTALAVTLPFIAHGLVLFIKGNRQTRLHLAAAGRPGSWGK